jgi:hypothetical protein
MKISKALRGNRDLPQLEAVSLASATAGTGTDFEQIVAVIPDLTLGGPSGSAGMQANNAMQARWFVLCWNAAITGTATNYAALQFKQRRAGVLLTNTTSSTVVTAGSIQTITVGSGGANNCYAGQSLDVSGGTGTAETIVVTGYNAAANTITAYFVNAHSSTYNVVSTPLAQYTYTNGNNETAWVKHQLKPLVNSILPGDVITVVRVSTGTGLATPAGYAAIEWVESGPQ